jgi:Ser/Thr protein kinase RdoA (MazF antagonist)
MKTEILFENATYRSQVLRLRELAKAVVKRYPIRVRKIEFIHHGENATFCIHATGGRKYLLRIHRGGYHTTAAIGEELGWLSKLAKRGALVPKPVRSKNGRFIESLATDRIKRERQCCLFEWVEGGFVGKKVSPRHMFELGELLAKLQASTVGIKSKHRRYWTAEGLVGTAPTFGPATHLAGVDRRHLAVVNRVRPKVLRALKNFERAHPKKMGLIHADLHFGNILKTKSGLAAIDFDDSGHGFFVYDLVIPLMSVQNILGKKRKREFPAFRKALLEGYAKHTDFGPADEAMILHLTAARRIAMLGWLNSRSDNPRLRAHLKGSAKVAAQFLKKNYR